MLGKGEGTFVLQNQSFVSVCCEQAKPKGTVSLCRTGIPYVEERAAQWVQQECCGCVPSSSTAPTARLTA